MARTRKAHEIASAGEAPAPSRKLNPKRPKAWRLPLIGVAIALASLVMILARVRTAVPRDQNLSVLLISIDTLRADAIGAYGNKSVLTPWMDRLAREGVRFENAHAHNVVTLPSHANMLSGHYPLTHGVRDNTGFRFPPDMKTLATRLKERGFQTAAFVSAFVLDSRFGLDRGFDLYDDHAPGLGQLSPFMVPSRKAEETLSKAVQWIGSLQDRQFLAFVHLYDPHFPYQPKEPYASRHRDQPYYGEVEATDAALEPLLKPFLDGPTGRNTLVILTSDHGEALGEHGESTHGTFAYESTLRVPLILRLQGVSNRVVSTPVRHIDIVPTILDALGMDAPTDLPGKSVWSIAVGEGPQEGFSSYFESLSTSLNQGWAPLRGLSDGRYKYIDLPLPELYDLEADPAELKNLVATEPGRLNLMQAALARQRAADKGVHRGDEDAVTIERLRALGYVGAAQAAPPKERYTAADDPKNLIAIDTRNREVVTLFMEGRLEEAITLAKANLKARPDMAGANLQLAYLERARGDLPAAVVAARRAVALKPLDAEAVSLLGAYLTEAGEPREAIALLEPYKKVTAPDFDVLTALGLAYSATGQFAMAREAFSGAREADPSSGSAMVNLGTLELLAGNRDAARAALEQALELDESLAKAHNTLGVLAAQDGRIQDAIARWRRAVELNPNDYQTLYNLGATLAKQGDNGLARSYFEAYVRTAPPALEARDIARTKDWLARHPK